MSHQFIFVLQARGTALKLSVVLYTEDQWHEQF
jgi:hypothetical protein